MKKKPTSGSRPVVSNQGPHSRVQNCFNVPAKDLFLYARSFHNAAKKVAGALELDSGLFSELGVCPVVCMYRHAIELHLKALVLGDGGNFLKTKPDALSVRKTRSVSWLAQFVVPIITAVKWEKEFTCDGIENLADFKAVIEDLNAVDPGSNIFRLPVISAAGQDSAQAGDKLTVRDFVRRMDALLELLDSTADALAATWDLHTKLAGQEGELQGGTDFEPTIQ